MPKQKKHCLVCGKIFLPRINHGKLQVFCSKTCSALSKKKSVCSHCGNIQLDNRCKKEGGPYNISLCKYCIEEWLQKRGVKDLICTICGRKKRIRPRKSIKIIESNYKCKSCCQYGPVIKRSCDIHYIFCKNCGLLSIKRSGSIKYCSSKCSRKDRQKQIICSDCGTKLNKSNRKHKSTSACCDQCMWIRRKKYKTAEIVGDITSRDFVDKIALMDLLTNYIIKEGGNLTWRFPDRIKRVKTLLEKHL